MNDLLVLGLGILSSLTLIMSALSTQRLRLLVFGLATSVLIGFQYAILDQSTALAGLLVGATWTLIVAFSLKVSVLQKALPWLIPVFIITHVIVFSTVTDWDSALTFLSFVPLISGVLSVVAFSFKQVVYTKAILVFLGILWATYQFNVGMYGQLVGEVATVCANFAAFIVLLKAKIAGVPGESVENLDTQILSTVTQSLPEAVTAVFTVPLHIIVPGQHPESVRYARMVEKHRHRLKDDDGLDENNSQ